MRNIIDLDGTEYLKRTYECAQAYKKYVADSGVMDILGREPELTGTETDAERLEKRRAQANKNAVDMTKLLYTDKADLTLGILPLFALTNADVSFLGGDVLAMVSSPVFFGVFFGLLLGKPIGIGLAVWLLTALKKASLPEGLTMKHFWAVGSWPVSASPCPCSSPAWPFPAVRS